MDTKANFVNKKVKKMAKSKRKKAQASRKGKAAEGQPKAGEYVGYLLELHKLQGVLLNKLRKEVQ